MTLANLTHGYEMISTPIASSTGAVSFSSTYIHLDTTAFDGTVTYNFEIVATNSNTTTAYSVLLCNSEGTTIGTAPVPASTTNPTRIRVTATGFLAGDDTYYIKTPATSVASQVKVYTARIIISQTNATKTRVQIPLTTNNYALTPVTADTALMTSTSITFVNLTNAYEYAMWKYTAANWTNVGSFILEAVTKSSNASGITSLSLNGIANTTATKTGTTLYVAQDTFNTTDLADGTSYKLQIKSNSASYTTSFYQANIYVNLSTIGNMEVRQRVHGGISAATTGVATSGSYSRVLIDTINNVNATYAESTGFCADNGTALNIADMGTVDVLGTPTILTGSTINFNSASDAVVTSQLASNPTATHRLQGESVTTTNAKTIGGLTLLYLIVYPFDPGIASSTGTSVVSSNDSTGIRLNERLLGSNTAGTSAVSCADTTGIRLNERLLGSNTAGVSNTPNVTSLKVKLASFGTSTSNGVSVVTGVKLSNKLASFGTSTSSGVSTVTGVKLSDKLPSFGTSTSSGVSTVTGVKLSDKLPSFGTSTSSGVSVVTSTFRLKLKETGSIISLSTTTANKLSRSFSFIWNKYI